MKKNIIFIITYLTILNFANSQIIPASIQQKIETLKKETKTGLDAYRTYPGNMRPHIPYRLSSELFWKEELLADSLKLNLHISMIYDDEMRDRLVQLMRNEYREDELDTLVNQRINNRIKGLETETLQICKLDTMYLFKVALDSFYINLPIKDMSKNMYKHDILLHLQIDTMTIFKQAFKVVVERERERSSPYYNHSNFARLCGYIGDKRFILPLVEALDKPDNFNREVVIEALARMRVEPYYSDYVTFRMPHTIERIKKERPDFEIKELVYVIGTQEAFLELSKYLLSDVPYTVEIVDYPDYPEHVYYPISDDAFDLIHDHIENEDFQEMIRGRNRREPLILRQTYDWMQKNYGKYKIKRIW